MDKQSKNDIDSSFQFDSSKLPSVSIFRLLFTFMTIKDVFYFIMAIIGSMGVGIHLQMNHILAGIIFTGMLDSGDENKILSTVNRVIIYFVILSFASLLCGFLMMGFFGYLSKRLSQRYKAEYFHMIMGMNQLWFDKMGKSPYELSHQMLLELEAIERGIGTTLGNIIGEISTVILCTIIGLILHWKFTLICIAIYPLWIGVQIFMMNVVSNISQTKRTLLEKVGGYMEEILYKIKTVASFANFDYEKENLNNELSNVLSNNKRSSYIISIWSSLFSILATLLDALFYGFMGLFIALSLEKNEEVINFGDLFVIECLMQSAAKKLDDMIPNLRILSECCSSGKLFFELKRYHEDIKNHQTDNTYLIKNIADDKKLKPANIKGKITFSNVSFSYPKRPNNNVLTDFNLEIPYGQTTAIIGKSGCGKTTIINLIERFYKPTKGDILLDDTINIDDINLEYYRDNIGFVSQEPVLFNDTIRNNILLGRKIENEDERIIESLKNAQIYKFIETLPEKLDYIVGVNGSKLSGGQKQRIAIARALLNNPKILIFDEATSSLDQKSEKQILKCLNSLQSKVTILIIAHRLSTIRNANNIVVLDKDGTIIEKGNHDELMEKRGKYFTLIEQELINQQNEEQETGDSDNSLITSKLSDTSKISDVIIPFESPIIENSPLIPQNQHKNEKQSPVIRFFMTFKQYMNYFIIGCIFSFLLGLFFPFLGNMIAVGLDNLNSRNPKVVRKQGTKFALIFVGLALLEGVLEFLRYFCFDYLGEITSGEFKKKIFSTFLKLHLGFFDIKENNPGNLVSSVTTKTNSINGVVFTLFNMLIQAAGIFISLHIICFIYDYRLTLINFVVCIFIIIANYFVIYYSSKQQKAKKSLNYGELLSQNLGNISTISSFNANNWSIAAVQENLFKTSEEYSQLSYYIGFFFGCHLFVVSVGYGIILFCGGNWYVNRTLEFGDFLRIYITIYFGQLFIFLALKYLSDINVMKEAIRDLFKQIEIKSEINPEETNPEQIMANRISFTSKIEFKNVSFAYPSNKKKFVLKNVSFVINPGEKVGIIGASGAGKSTITQLIERFYDPQEGQILLNDIDIKKYNIKSLRKEIGYVQQEPNLFTRTTFDNIKYGNLEATDDTVNHYASKCCISHKLNVKCSDTQELIDSKNSDVLSGGEKQRVAIARALIREPKILLLDEATSALDNNTEDEIQNMIDKIISEEKMTVIVIAHRLRAVQECDKCFLIQKGSLVKIGTFNEIMEIYE